MSGPGMMPYAPHLREVAAAVLRALADWSDRDPLHELTAEEITELWDRSTTDEVRAGLPG